MRKIKWMAIVWPAFLMAGVLEVLVFALVDPNDLRWLGRPVELSRQSVYTMAFFVFWAVTLLTCGITALLCLSPVEVND